MNEKMAEFVGICLGDGCISITKRYNEFAVSGHHIDERRYYNETVIPLFNELFARRFLKKNVTGKTDKTNGVYGIHVFNKEIVNALIRIGLPKSPKRNIEIPEKFTSKKLVKHVLRGLFDTDGTVYFNKSTSGAYSQPRIRLGSTSKKLIVQVKDALEKLGFSPFMKKPYKGKRDKITMYYVCIYKKKDIEMWSDTIGFNNCKHLQKIKKWKTFGYCHPNNSQHLCQT